MAKKIQNFAKHQINKQYHCTTYFKYCQSAKIWQNLVTLPAGPSGALSWKLMERVAQQMPESHFPEEQENEENLNHFLFGMTSDTL